MPIDPQFTSGYVRDRKRKTPEQQKVWDDFMALDGKTRSLKYHECQNRVRSKRFHPDDMMIVRRFQLYCRAQGAAWTRNKSKKRV